MTVSWGLREFLTEPHPTFNVAMVSFSSSLYINIPESWISDYDEKTFLSIRIPYNTVLEGLRK